MCASAGAASSEKKPADQEGHPTNHRVLFCCQGLFKKGGFIFPFLDKASRFFNIASGSAV